MDAGGSRPSSQQTPARLTNCPRPSTVSVFSSPVLCFHIFLTVLLCLWFLIELPRSDNSSGCYIILSNSAPSAGHYLTATTPGLPGGQQSMTSLASIWWVEGWAGQEPRGAKHAMAGCEGDMCPGLTCYDTGTACSRYYEALSRATTALSRDLPTDNDILIPQEIFNWIIVTKYCLLNQVVSYCNLLGSPWTEYNVFCTISRENPRI